MSQKSPTKASLLKQLEAMKEVRVHMINQWSTFIEMVKRCRGCVGNSKKALQMMEKALRETMPGVRHIACQDYEILNTAPIAAGLSIKELNRLEEDISDILSAKTPKVRKEKTHYEKLLMEHARMIRHGNHYAYFELAYTRQTMWMAFLCNKPKTDDPDRIVLAKGQGKTPEEACKLALESLPRKKCKPKAAAKK